MYPNGFKKTKETKNQRLKIGIGIEKSNETRLKIMLRIHLIISLSCIYPEHISTDLLSHAYYRDPYFDFIAPLADVTRLKQKLRAQS